MPVTDRIEKQVTLKAPRGRVWRALTDATESGSPCDGREKRPGYNAARTSRSTMRQCA